MVMEIKGLQTGNGLTYWETVAMTRWGRYTSETAKRAILFGHASSPEPSAALELGCEGGRWSRLLADFGWKMVCTDVNPEALEICRQRIPEAECILVNPDDNRIPRPSQSADLLLCIEVAPVIQSDLFIDEAFRVLRKNGLVVGVFWNLLSLRGLFVRLLKPHSPNMPVFYRLAYPPWKKRLTDKGFTLIYEEGYCWFPFHRDSDSALIPFCLAVEKGLRLSKLLAFSPWIAFVARKNA